MAQKAATRGPFFPSASKVPLSTPDLHAEARPDSLAARPAVEGVFAERSSEKGQCPLIYNCPELVERGVVWLARHTVHEVNYHPCDVDRLLNEWFSAPGAGEQSCWGAGLSSDGGSAPS